MASTKATFTLDDETIAHLNMAAARLGKPKSRIVREAIHEYAARIGRLSEQERRRMLRLVDEMGPRIPRRPLAEVEAEIEAIHVARRGGGRLTPADE